VLKIDPQAWPVSISFSFQLLYASANIRRSISNPRHAASRLARHARGRCNRRGGGYTRRRLDSRARRARRRCTCAGSAGCWGIGHRCARKCGGAGEHDFHAGARSSRGHGTTRAGRLQHRQAAAGVARPTSSCTDPGWRRCLSMLSCGRGLLVCVDNGDATISCVRPTMMSAEEPNTAQGARHLRRDYSRGGAWCRTRIRHTSPE